MVEEIKKPLMFMFAIFVLLMVLPILANFTFLSSTEQASFTAMRDEYASFLPVVGIGIGLAIISGLLVWARSRFR